MPIVAPLAPLGARARSFEKPDLGVLESIIQSPAATRDERVQLCAYKKMIDTVTGMVFVEYTRSEYGRFFGCAKKGLHKNYFTGTTMRRVFRNMVFGEAYDDLDIVNASGAIMCQLYQKHGLSTESISYYNEHREEVLGMIMTHNPQRQVERATAKTTLIEVFNCGSGRESMQKELGAFVDEHALPPFVEELKREIWQNVDSIVKLPEFSGIMAYVTKKAEDKGKEAWLGQFAATVYQEEERKCLEVIAAEVEKIARERKIENPIGSLIYDGMTVKKELGIEGHIARLEMCITRKTEYTLKLEIKEMSVSAEERAAYIGDIGDMSYEALKARFETRHFKTENCKSPFHSTNVKTGDVVSRSMDAFKVAYMDWIPVGGRQFLDRWLNDGLKRAYEHIEHGCVKKEDQESTVYYAFPAMRHESLVSISTESEKQANVDYFLDYVKLLVEDRPEYVEWMTMWLADILVNPDNKGETPVAVVLWGEQGAGKTFLRELMAHFLGGRLVHHTDDPQRNGDIMHDFNSTLKYKLFIEFEEINFKTHSKVADNIKALITGHTHTITHKGQDSSSNVKASERILFTTNSAGSVVIDSGDRRYAAFAVSARRVGDGVYWTEHYRKLKDQSYIRDVAEYLLSHKAALAQYALRDKRPITDYYKSLQQLSLSPELDFLRDAFLVGAFGQEFLAQFLSGAGLYAIPSSMMCCEYNRWRAENGMKEQISSKSFTMKMVSHGSGYGIRRDTAGSKHNAFLVDSAKLRASLARHFDARG
jgi:hypothetical protein